MNINFQFHGSLFNAGITLKDEKSLIVEFDNLELTRQFGPSLPFFVENRSVNFNTFNQGHSELYELNSTISKAIAEQCADIL